MNTILTKKFFFLIFLFVVLAFTNTARLYAQFEAGKWIFGNNAGVDFCSGKPVAIEGCALKTNEGCASISDSQGNLLFYTDGITVWNRMHQPMPDGKGLLGHNSSTQSAIIVPLPEKKNIYYIFTMDSEANKNGLCLSVVDMNSQNGLGNVVFKNRPIKAPCNERLLSVGNTNGKDSWILVQEHGSDAFYAYPVTKNGFINTPVVSNMKVTTDKSIYSSIGYIKASSDRTKLALAINDQNLVQLCHFDAATGKVSNLQTIRMPGNSNPYGLEFSPDNKLLYISIVQNGTIFQLNTEAGDESKIQKTLALIGQTKNKVKLGALQMAIDGKIYIAEYLSNYLSVIDNPNAVGVACGYRQQAVFLGRNHTSMFGLPTFYRDYVKTNVTDQNQIFKPGPLQTGIIYRLSNVYFDFDKATIREESVTELKDLSAYLSQNDSLSISITGHTDSVGTDSYNLTLSLERARAIGMFLQNNGIHTHRIQYSGKGSQEPLADNDTEEGRQKNRRVEFILLGKNTKIKK